MSLAEKIAYLRKKNSLSQEELSERLDVSRQAVSKWEAAESVPDIANLVRISALFGVSVDFMVKNGCGTAETEMMGGTAFSDSAEIREFLCRGKARHLRWKRKRDSAVPKEFARPFLFGGLGRRFLQA